MINRWIQGISHCTKNTHILFVVVYKPKYHVGGCTMLYTVYLSMCFIYIYIDTYMHACIHTNIHTYIQTNKHTYIHTNKHTYIHTNIHAYKHTYIHTCIQTDIHTYICLYIYTHTQRERERAGSEGGFESCGFAMFQPLQKPCHWNYENVHLLLDVKIAIYMYIYIYKLVQSWLFFSDIWIDFLIGIVDEIYWYSKRGRQ